jgi:hypothetical protein
VNPTFRTTFTPLSTRFQFSHRSPLLMIGSCFSENMGKKFQSFKFPLEVNPFGILYDPLSILKNLQALMKKESYTSEDLEYDGEYWWSYQHHSRFSSLECDDCLRRINQSFYWGKEQLKKCHYLILTWGTARVYEHKTKKESVANCHKKPASIFHSFLLSPQEIVERYAVFFQELKEYNPACRVLLTLSPIRHWAQGAIANQRSKAILLVAIHELLEQFSFIEYFPSYEIFMDDLRDYRFYQGDLIHPNEQAMEYLWKIIQETYMTPQTLELLRHLEKLHKAQQHRPFHPRSPSYQQFLQQQLHFIENLEKHSPNLDFSAERSFFENPPQTSYFVEEEF